MKAAAIEKERESGRFQGAFRAERQKTDKLTEEIEKKVNLVAKLENMIKRLVVNKDLNLLKQLEQVFTKPEKNPARTVVMAGELANLFYAVFVTQHLFQAIYRVLSSHSSIAHLVIVKNSPVVHVLQPSCFR